MGTTKFKIGDRVFSYTLQEWGTVERKVTTSRTTITVYFDNLENKRMYEEDGRLSLVAKAPDLFYNEVIITPPPRPLPDLNVDDKVIVWNDPDFKCNRHFASWNGNVMNCFYGGTTSWGTPHGEGTCAWENPEIIKEKEN